MITETREIYKCDYCKKMYQRKSACIRHEDVCFKSPDFLRPCHSCVNLEKRATTVFSGRVDGNGNEYEMAVNLLFCKKRDCFIHPHKVAVKGNAFETAKENIEMPKECELHEDGFEEGGIYV